MILSSQTVATPLFEERVRAAAAAGCNGIGLRPKDYARAVEAGLSDETMRELLREAGVEVTEHQALRGWAADDVSAREAEEELFTVADALGGTYVIAIAGETADGITAIARRLATLADRAVAHGLLVALEFLPWSAVPDAATAWSIVRAADHPNVGVLVDAWHLFRGPGDIEQLRAIPGDRVVAVHLADADAEPQGTLLEDTLRRRVPGEGELPLVDFVRALDGIGVGVDYAVEVLSREQQELPPREAAWRAAEGARRVLAAAR
jgi:sugar phosphate isomerase/epimerase